MKKRLASLTTALLLLSAGSAFGAIISAYENPADFGNLDQASVNCPNTACGPTAATNSFLMLQRTHPELYGSLLIPGSGFGGAVTYQDLIDVANTLGTEPYMGSCGCFPQTGTYIEDFIMGKMNYINSVAPGTTTFEAQIGINWLQNRNPNPAPNTTAPKPAGVQQNTIPTAQWIRDQIDKGQDVEIFVGYNAGGAHYLTLTGITFDTVLNTGSISFIDPLGGLAGTSNITGLDGGAGNALALDYSGGADIFSAVAESAVPEPGTVILLGLGSLLIVVGRRKAAARLQ